MRGISWPTRADHFMNQKSGPESVRQPQAVKHIGARGLEPSLGLCRGHLQTDNVNIKCEVEQELLDSCRFV